MNHSPSTDQGRPQPISPLLIAINSFTPKQCIHHDHGFQSFINPVNIKQTMSSSPSLSMLELSSPCSILTATIFWYFNQQTQSITARLLLFLLFCVSISKHCNIIYWHCRQWLTHRPFLRLNKKVSAIKVCTINQLGSQYSVKTAHNPIHILHKSSITSEAPLPNFFVKPINQTFHSNTIHFCCQWQQQPHLNL